MSEDHKKLNIYVDIDETIARTIDGDYPNATPILKNIKVINKLYEEGHQITYWTGRGTVTKIDWYDLTEKQLGEWGCKYHKLMMGKPAFDIILDDKAINSYRFFDKTKDTMHIVAKDLRSHILESE